MKKIQEDGKKNVRTVFGQDIIGHGTKNSAFFWGYVGYRIPFFFRLRPLTIEGSNLSPETKDTTMLVHAGETTWVADKKYGFPTFSVHAHYLCLLRVFIALFLLNISIPVFLRERKRCFAPLFCAWHTLCDIFDIRSASDGGGRAGQKHLPRFFRACNPGNSHWEERILLILENRRKPGNHLTSPGERNRARHTGRKTLFRLLLLPSAVCI